MISLNCRCKYSSSYESEAKSSVVFIQGSRSCHPTSTVLRGFSSFSRAGSVQLDMEFTQAFVLFQFCLPRMHHLFTLLCLLVVVYKVSVLLLKRKAVLRSIDAFPGPPGHWLFGHVFQVTQLTSFQQRGNDDPNFV